MKILLDENFPLQLYWRLLESGHDVEHIIVLGQRGIPDAAIRDRLRAEALVFVTSDLEFRTAEAHPGGLIAISRIPQARPISERVDLWSRALEALMRERPAGRVFALLETGEAVEFR